MASAAACAVVAQEVEVVEVDGGPPMLDGGLPEFEIDDEPPMGLTDVASVFPFAGPFAPNQKDGTPGDRFLHETLGGIDRTFLEQLMPVLQARWPTAAHPCGADVSKLCPHADVPLHCLGTNAGKLTKECKQEIRHTVPYVCEDEIHRFCEDDLEVGIIPCLEKKGVELSPDCAGAIIAAKHAISSLSTSQRKAQEKMAPVGQPKSAKEKARDERLAKSKAPKDAAKCPAGWEGPKGKGCCTRRWSLACDATCSAKACAAASGGWEFKWLDFRHHPYTCCPKTVDHGSKYIGGQPMCPKGWYVENKRLGHCCRRPWTWGCGEFCAEEQCSMQHGFEWHKVNPAKDHYRCCPDAFPGVEPVGPDAPSKADAAEHAAKHGPAAAKPDRGVAGTRSHAEQEEAFAESLPGASWPLDLGAGHAAGALVASICVVALFLRRVFGSSSEMKEL